MSSRLSNFYREHKSTFFLVLGGLLIIILLVVVIVTTTSTDDGVEGTSSKDYESSLAADEKALKNTPEFKIAEYLPITNQDPAYTISYDLSVDETGNYSLKLTLDAFSASARDAMVKRLLNEDFGGLNPLSYEIELLNYYNPFTNVYLEDLKSESYPANVKKGSLYKFGDSTYTVQTLIHTLYDGSTNNYRYVLENGEPKTKPQLFFTYSDLPYLNSATVRSLNALE